MKLNSLKDFHFDQNVFSKQFEKDLNELGIHLEEKQFYQFKLYYEILMEWNSFMNLTAITDFDDVLKKHFIDSLSLVKADVLKRIGSEENVSEGYDIKNISMIDVGTGAGFPGIPLKIAFPDLNITLLDSLKKRVCFLEEVVNKLELKNISVIHGRAEDFAKENEGREKYDFCVSRAVANLSTLSEYCIPFVKKKGKFICYKSEKLTDELSEAKRAIFVLGGKVEKQVDFFLPSSDIYRNLLVIDKIKETPLKFPRKAGLPSREPIK